MGDEIHDRLARLYAALGVVEKQYSTDAGPQVYKFPTGTWIHQDFRAGQSDAELMNQATILIYNIANLFDHLRSWADENGADKAVIEQAQNTSDELKIIKDLANDDRHGQPLRKSHSGQWPRLVNVNRVMLFQANEGVPSCEMHLGDDGKWVYSEGSTQKAVVTARIVDSNGNRMGDLYETALSSSGTNLWPY